jgi:hypothetical protein
MQELWRPVVGYEGLYEVSDKGAVRSVDRMKRGLKDSRYFVKGRVLRQSFYRYWAVTLYKDGRGRTQLVHKLVLEAFVGPRPRGNTVACHGPLGPEVNTLENLRWDTQVSNLADRRKDGTMLHGSRHGMARLSEQDVLDIRKALADGVSQRALGRLYGVTSSLIWRIHHRLLWTHI